MSGTGAPASTLRVGVYTDYAYVRAGGHVHAERAFALFIDALSAKVGAMTVFGRLRSRGGEARYRLSQRIAFVPLPFYESLAKPLTVLRATVRSLLAFWRGARGLDLVWVLGPHPLGLLFAALARLRGCRVVLGVRQDLIAYAESRHPGRRSFAVLARTLERAWLLLGRRWPVVVVGPALRERYRDCPWLLEIAVSLVPAARLIPEGADRRCEPPVEILSVGRIDREKNPLLLAEVAALLEAGDSGRFRLLVCGEGPMEEELRRRVAELGAGEVVELCGYLDHARLLDAYAEADLLLHVSWTEGLPQVIIEALAARLPVVATDVGGIGSAVGPAATLIPPGDAGAATAALRELAGSAELRRRRQDAGTEFARGHTLEAEIETLTAFLAGAEGQGPAERVDPARAEAVR